MARGSSDATALGIAQDQGARPYQEDRAVRMDLPKGTGFVLCDGMGGHAGGDVAASLATEHFAAVMAQASERPVPDRLAAALKAANQALAEALAQSDELEGMGATLVGVVIDDGRVWWVSVGDSPLWVIRNGETLRLNENHSLAAVVDAAARRGEISEEQARRDPRRNQLRSAVMGHEIDLVDLPSRPTELEAGDIVLAASDGVETLSDLEIGQLVSSRAAAGMPQVAGELVEAVIAREKRRQDNVTVCLYQFPGRKPAAGGSASRPGRRYLALGIVAILLGVIAASGIYFVPKWLDARSAAVDDAEAGDTVIDGDMAAPEEDGDASGALPDPEAGADGNPDAQGGADDGLQDGGAPVGDVQTDTPVDGIQPETSADDVTADDGTVDVPDAPDGGDPDPGDTGNGDVTPQPPDR